MRGLRWPPGGAGRSLAQYGLARPQRGTARGAEQERSSRSIDARRYRGRRLRFSATDEGAAVRRRQLRAAGANPAPPARPRPGLVGASEGWRLHSRRASRCRPMPAPSRSASSSRGRAASSTPMRCGWKSCPRTGSDRRPCRPRPARCGCPGDSPGRGAPAARGPGRGRASCRARRRTSGSRRDRRDRDNG